MNKKLNQKKYNICLTYGTFDMFHYGHFSILLRCKNQCKKLIIGVSTDFYNKNKNKESFQNELQRFNFINALPFVDKVIYENDFKTQWKKDYKKYKADVIFIGDDHKGELDYLIEKGINIIYLNRTQGVSTSDIKDKLRTKKVTFFVQNEWNETEKLFKNINKYNSSRDNFLILAINSKNKGSSQLYDFWNGSKKLDFIFLFKNLDEINKLKEKINSWKKN